MIEEEVEKKLKEGPTQEDSRSLTKRRLQDDDEEADKQEEDNNNNEISQEE